MDIDNHLTTFKDTFLPKDFQWRKGQKEVIKQIIETYLEGKQKVVVLDAPVGSGKSLIAMTVSWILNQIDKYGYILASDIALQEQYESDFHKMNLNWGKIKGLNNYTCTDNFEKVNVGTCKIKNITPTKMSCYAECPYYSARDHAAVAPTSLLNYAYWLIMMNYLYEKADEGQKILFEPRNFLICDEAHKILDIVQNHYSPRINDSVEDKLKKLTDFFDNHNINDHANNLNNIKSKIKEISYTEDNDKLFKALKSIETSLLGYLTSANVLKETVKRNYKHEQPPKEWKRILSICEWLKDFHCKIEDYIEIIEKTSIDHIVKNPSGKDIVFNCLEESYLMQKYFHKWSKFTVLMSATFSDPSEYIKSIALSGAKYIKMESDFNFEKSPIYFYNQYRMSYNHIDRNLPWLNKTINDLIKKHDGERGIIHTASYNLTMKIYESLTPENRKRILIYNGAEEKRDVLDKLKRLENKILMGPSLLEGLDMKNEWSRFQIFAKIPYPSLGDNFVKRKMEKNPIWYQWKTILGIIQGLGRTIRTKDDWSITYILDASFVDLLHKNRKMFSNDVLNRIKLVK